MDQLRDGGENEIDASIKLPIPLLNEVDSREEGDPNNIYKVPVIRNDDCSSCLLVREAAGL